MRVCRRLRVSRTRLGSVLLALSMSGTPLAAAPPQPSCAKPPDLSYSDPGASPSIRVWRKEELGRAHWAPPDCLSWRGPTRFAVELAGDFRRDGDIEDILGRLGAVSRYSSIRYWSASAGAWRPLAEQAWALSDPDPARRRADFTAAEVLSGADLYYTQKEDRTGTVVYRMRTIVASRHDAVISIENVSTIRFHILPLFEPGALQTAFFLDRRAPGVWNLYELTRTGEGATLLAGGHEASYLNRSVALFRYLAGIPTDRDPPAAP